MSALGPGWSEGSRWGMAASLAWREDVKAKVTVSKPGGSFSQTLLTAWASRKGPSGYWDLRWSCQ